jgi:hypothetical protein
MNMASQNYYAGYYSKRRYNPSRKNSHNGGSSGTTSASLANASKFQVMDYEIEASIQYTLKKKLQFTFTPTMAIPVNPATVTVTSSGGTGSSTETLNSVFYFSVGFTYSF